MDISVSDFKKTLKTTQHTIYVSQHTDKVQEKLDWLQSVVFNGLESHISDRPASAW